LILSTTITSASYTMKSTSLNKMPQWVMELTFLTIYHSLFIIYT